MANKLTFLLLLFFTCVYATAQVPVALNAGIGRSIERMDSTTRAGLNKKIANDDVLTIADTMPDFPGDLDVFLKDNLKYPADALEKGFQGMTILSFVVEKDGSITQPRVSSSSRNAACDAEALRLLSIMPKWLPGQQYGKKVRVQSIRPIRFSLPGRLPANAVAARSLSTQALPKREEILSAPVNNSYTKEAVEFTFADTIVLKGILHLPKDKPKAIVVFLDNPTLGRYLDPKKSDTLWYDFNLVQKLFEKNIGYLVYNTRASSEASRSSSSSSFVKSFKLQQSTSGQTYADDADAAIAYLRSRNDTKKLSIGLSGASAGGCSAAIVASRNKNVDFLISISTLFTGGLQVYKYGTTNSPVNPLIDRLYMEDFRSMVKDTFIYNGVKFLNTESAFRECFLHSVDTINSQIVKYSNYDTIRRVAGEMMCTLLPPSNFKLDHQRFKDGLTPELYLKIFLPLSRYSADNIEMIKWNPTLYYPKIKIPTLILFGDKDNTIDVVQNIQAAKKLATDYDKKNFKIVVLENVQHGLMDVKELEAFKQKTNGVTSIKMSQSALKAISDWLDNSVF